MLTPALFFLSAAVALGVYLGLQFLRGNRNKPVLIGGHLLLGFIGLEALFTRMRGINAEGTLQPNSFATLTLLTLVVAMIVGFLSPLLGKQSRKAGTYALGAHATIAATGFVLVVILATKT